MLEEINVSNIDVEEWMDIAMMYGLKAVFALVILVVGWIAAKMIRKGIRRTMSRANMDQTLSNFLSNIVYAITLAFVIIATLNKVGVQTASLIAVIGAAGLAIGLALQGSLSNFAAGVMIILFRHFKVGDFIEGAGVTGTVKNLDIFNTTLITPNNQKVIIPNSNLTSDAITNFSDQDTRRIDEVIGIGYEDDIAKAKSVILEEIGKISNIHSTPEPTVAVKSLGDSSVNLAVRCWTDTDDYWNVLFELIENVKVRFDHEGISIPYPQRDIHLYQTT